MDGNERQRRAVLTRMMRLADSRGNDTVRLTLQKEGVTGKEIEGMDLNALTELKRNAGGAVEVKFVDRMAILSRLYEMLRESGNGELDAFLEAAGSADV